ncbi:hypothetical protein BDF19DRAFT_494468 [Syncephalis fuscata]|nr:hypothetical protein BDF19DRAFT_494468 [Syncephalis fuscata]
MNPLLPVVKKKDASKKKNKKKEKTTLSFNLDEEGNEEVFQLKKNVVSTVATDNQREATETVQVNKSKNKLAPSTSVASLYGYDPTLHQRQQDASINEDELEGIPDAAAINAAKKQRAHRRKMADWKHSVLVGDQDTEDHISFLVTDDKNKTKEKQHSDAVASALEDAAMQESEASDAEEFNAYENQLIHRAMSKQQKKPQRASNLPPVVTPVPSVTSCPTVDQVAKLVKSTTDTVNHQLAQDESALEKARISRDQAHTGLEALNVETEACCARFEFFEQFKDYVNNLADLIDTKMPALEELETRKNSLLENMASKAMEHGSLFYNSNNNFFDGLHAALKQQFNDNEAMFTDITSEAILGTIISDEYATAYIELCLPPIFDAYIRLELLQWLPFESKNTQFFKDMDWFQKMEQAGYTELKTLVATVLRKSVMPQVIFGVYIPYLDSHTQWIHDLLVWLRNYDVVPKKFTKPLEERIQACIDQHAELLQHSNLNQQTPILIEMSCALLRNICRLGHESIFSSLSVYLVKLIDTCRRYQPTILQSNTWTMTLALMPEIWRQDTELMKAISAP